MLAISLVKCVALPVIFCWLGEMAASQQFSICRSPFLGITEEPDKRAWAASVDREHLVPYLPSLQGNVFSKTAGALGFAQLLN